MRKFNFLAALIIFTVMAFLFPRESSEAQGNVSLSGNNVMTGANRITFSRLTSSSSNPASTGQIRLSNTDGIEFRDAANDNDVLLNMSGGAAGNYPADLLYFGGNGIETNGFMHQSLVGASSGFLRMISMDSLCWRNQAGSGDVCASKDSSDNLTWPNAVVSGGTQVQDGTYGSKLSNVVTGCETTFGITTLNTGGTTTDTGVSCLPANSIIDAVVARVTTTITSACTGWELGDGTTAARFSSNNTGLTAGTTTDATHIGTFNNTGIASATTGMWQASAAKVRVTCAGGNPGAGAIRIIVYSHTWTAPTS